MFISLSTYLVPDLPEFSAHTSSFPCILPETFCQLINACIYRRLLCLQFILYLFHPVNFSLLNTIFWNLNFQMPTHLWFYFFSSLCLFSILFAAFFFPINIEAALFLPLYTHAYSDLIHVHSFKHHMLPFPKYMSPALISLNLISAQLLSLHMIHLDTYLTSQIYKPKTNSGSSLSNIFYSQILHVCW